MKLLSLMATIFLISNTGSALGACTATLTSPGGTAFTLGSFTTITLSATVPIGATGCGTVGQVAFYSGGTTLLGASTSPDSCTASACTYTIPWAPNTANTYTLTAQVFGTSGTLAPIVTTTVMDIVGESTVQYQSGLYNPALDSSFGITKWGLSIANWQEGDNQFCSTTGTPYNGFNVPYPDGSCEWMNEANILGTTNQKPASITQSTIDGLDDTMHTLSDFATFSSSLLNVDQSQLRATFSNWYPQLVQWVGPACTVQCTLTEQEENICNGGSADSTCNQGGNGRLLNIYNPPLPGGATPQGDLLANWNTNVITPWLNNIYTSPTAWCVPSENTLKNGSTTTLEDTYITNNTPPTTCSGGIPCPTTGSTAGQCPDGSACSHWGDLSHVIACLNYNIGSNTPPSSYYSDCLTALTSGACPQALPPQCSYLSPPSPPVTFQGNQTTDCQTFYPNSWANWLYNSIYKGPAYNFRQCQLLLQSPNCSTVITMAGNPCLPSVWGRSLVSALPNTIPTASSCSSASFLTNVSNSRILFTDETPKFALRSAFLTDIYNRATSMKNILAQEDTMLQNFLKPCESASTCASGGPVAQLGSAAKSITVTSTDPASLSKLLPNAVIYGWMDNNNINGHVGYAHIVKVAAFSAGRGGGTTIVQGVGITQPKLPWIQDWSTFFTQYFTLRARDGYVYVDVKRWDEDHSNVLTFPNTHTLWQFLFHAPGNGVSGGTGIPPECLNPSEALNGTNIGYGLLQSTVTGLNSQITSGGKTDTGTITALTNAFMLNDRGDGNTDPLGGGGTYLSCLKTANSLANSGVESTACAQYIASRNASRPSGTQDNDYSVKFVPCGQVPYIHSVTVDDLTGA